MARILDRRSSRQTVLVLALLSATALAGCQQKSADLGSMDGVNTASTAPASYQATVELARAWQSDPGNISKGVAYANALESLGQTDKQMEVYARLHAAHPGNTKLSSLYGKKLLANGRASEAVPVLERAVSAADADWRTRSALGSAYDQQGLYQKAREQYDIVLATDANNLTVLNNLGMSYALEGDLRQAEAVLRRADALPRSKTQPRIRQNLALVVGLQGRFDEARQIASADLPKDQVEANMEYLKKMMAQQDTWAQISEARS